MWLFRRDFRRPLTQRERDDRDFNRAELMLYACVGVLLALACIGAIELVTP